MPQLDPTWFASQLFWLAVTFAVLYVVSARLLLPPLLRLIDERHGKVAGDIATAEKLKAEAEEARLEYERALADARMKAQAAFNEAMEVAKAAAEKAHQEMDRSIERKMAEAERRINDQKAHLAASLQPAIAEMTTSIVQKLGAAA